MDIGVMNDTLDNYIFTQLYCDTNTASNEISKNTTNISLDDSLFLQSSQIDEIDSNSIEKLAEKLSSSSLLEEEEVELTEKCIPQIFTPEDYSLTSMGLPLTVLNQYKSRGIVTMFPWQLECLHNEQVMKYHKNLVYSAPTSAGKTLVAEILAMKTLFEMRKKVVMILPYVSVVREKMYYFQDILNGSGVRVDGFMGSYNPPGGFQSVQLAICTIEKANSIINRSLQQNQLDEIGLIIIDEIHLIGDQSRGYLLELLLTKIKYYLKKNSNIQLRLVGMSATIPNLDQLADWLDAVLYTTQFRPIPLQESVKIADVIYDKNMAYQRKLEKMPELDVDTDDILQLCLETINESCSILIFCPTKNWCENLAQQIAYAFRTIGLQQNAFSQLLHRELESELIFELLQQLQSTPVGLDEVLKKTVSFGVSFHHAGLTMDERDLVEMAFRQGVIRVLIATSTLASGVNLPARRVIIRTPIFLGKPLDRTTYRQMIGRAGRMGKDVKGESILIAQKNEKHLIENILATQLGNIESCLKSQRKLERVLLEVIASGIVNTPEDIQTFLKCTILNSSDYPLDSVLKFLLEHHFIANPNGLYQATQLGIACLTSSLSPDDGLILFDELEKARKCLVLDTDIHLIYLIIPTNACEQLNQIDWFDFLDLWQKMLKSAKTVGNLVGVTDSFLINATKNKFKSSRLLLIHKRFYIALILQDLINEVPLMEICSKFHCNRGLLQSLQQTSAQFAGILTNFTKELGWLSLELLLKQFAERLQFGIKHDLLDLMRLQLFNSKSARALHSNGIETLVQLANSDLNTIEIALKKAIPFDRKALKNLWIQGREACTEKDAAQILLVESRKYLKYELGLVEATWEMAPKTNDIDSSNSDLSRLDISNQSLFTTNSNTSLFDDDSFLTTTQNLEKSPDIFENCSKKRHLQMSDEKILKKSRKCIVKNFNEFELINVCMNVNLFNLFLNELEQKNVIALTLACIRNNNIKILPRKILEKNQEENPRSLHSYGDITVEGIALSWGSNQVYFIDLKVIPNLNKLKNLLMKPHLNFYIFDGKEHLKILENCLKIKLSSKIIDPKLGDWLLDPEGKEKNLQSLAFTYTPQLTNLLKLCGLIKDSGSVGLNPTNTVKPKIRASIECLITWHSIDSIRSTLLEKSPKLLNLYDMELDCMKCLAQLELNGIFLDQTILQNLSIKLRKLMEILEKKLYNSVGYKFAINSTKQIAKILGKNQSNSLNEMIGQWRKMHSTLTNSVQPLLRTMNPTTNRIHCCSIQHTVTGRISMCEPNLQNIPKNYVILNEEIDCRKAFKSTDNYQLISADYCQLEFRLLSHFSKDVILNRIMQTDCDVFKLIASKWYNVNELSVTDVMRQRTKQLSYGIIYGMSSKTLAEQMEIDEENAMELMDSFKLTYPGLNDFMQDVVEKCRLNGFVETLAGRRRYLPRINDANPMLKAQAERQALNTTIQGSAADLVKKAIIALESNLQKLEYKSRFLLHLHDELLYEVPIAHLKQTAQIIKHTMENVIKLTIPLPVKLKSGINWSEMYDITL